MNKTVGRVAILIIIVVSLMCLFSLAISMMEESVSIVSSRFLRSDNVAFDQVPDECKDGERFHQNQPTDADESKLTWNAQVLATHCALMKSPSVRMLLDRVDKQYNRESRHSDVISSQSMVLGLISFILAFLGWFAAFGQKKLIDNQNEIIEKHKFLFDELKKETAIQKDLFLDARKSLSSFHKYSLTLSSKARRELERSLLKSNRTLREHSVMEISLILKPSFDDLYTDDESLILLSIRRISSYYDVFQKNKYPEMVEYLKFCRSHSDNNSVKFYLTNFFTT